MSYFHTRSKTSETWSSPQEVTKSAATDESIAQHKGYYRHFRKDYGLQPDAYLSFSFSRLVLPKTQLSDKSLRGRGVPRTWHASVCSPFPLRFADGLIDFLLDRWYLSYSSVNE